MQKVMRIRLVLVVLLFNMFYVHAQDGVNVFLTESDSVLHACLNFENQRLDTIIVSGRFKNFYMGWESSQGINILTYRNDRFFKLANYGDMQGQEYIDISTDRFLFIPPLSKQTFDINLSRYFHKVDGDLSVEFEINYIFMPYNKKENRTTEIKRITTNRVNVKNDISCPRYK